MYASNGLHCRSVNDPRTLNGVRPAALAAATTTHYHWPPWQLRGDVAFAHGKNISSSTVNRGGFGSGSICASS